MQDESSTWDSAIGATTRRGLTALHLMAGGSVASDIADDLRLSGLLPWSAAPQLNEGDAN